MSVTETHHSSPPPSPLRLRAAVVWADGSDPIPDGAVLVGASGRIEAVGCDREVPRPEGVREQRFPDGVLLPGFVNAHTHLELHGLRGQIPDAEFFDWIQHVRRAKAQKLEDDFQAAASEGLRDCWQHGITYVCDTGTSGAVAAAMGRLGGAGTVYHEVIAPEPDQSARAMDAVKSMLRRTVSRYGRVIIGISPHAPYTVSPALVAESTRFAREHGLPMAGHVAESVAEWDFVTRGEGPFASLWEARGIPLPDRASSPTAYLEQLGVLGPDFLAIHAVQLGDRDVEILARTGTRVAACPRSNQRHGHGVPPLRKLRDAGVPVLLGSDSVASVESVDVLADARVAVQHCGLEPVEAVGMIAWDAGRHLRDVVGRIERGRWGDVAVLAVDPTTDPELLAWRLLEGGGDAVRHTFVGGRCVYSR